LTQYWIVMESQTDRQTPSVTTLTHSIAGVK